MKRGVLLFCGLQYGLRKAGGLYFGGKSHFGTLRHILSLAELFVNGKSFGEKAYLYPADGIDEWPKFDLTKPSANTDDLFLSWDVPYEKGEVTALGYDRDGNFAILSKNELKVSVEGPAELLVVENGNGRDHTLGRNPVRKAHYGRLFAVVRSRRGEEGTISISVSGEGLSPDTICLESKNQQ